MAAHLAQTVRRDSESEQLYERYAPSIYRYALAVLTDPADAEHVTRATFVRAAGALERGTRPTAPATWLLRIAHALCRRHTGYAESVADELAHDPADERDDACHELAPLISRDLDGLLAPRDSAALRAHLRECEACRSLALRQRAAQAAVRALAALPLPPSLALRH